MDISDTLAPKSDQLDGIDLVGGPRTFTVERVSRGNADQPVNVHLAEFPRPWRPGKNMRRVLAYCWGKDASQWAGRRVTLYYDPDVKFGNERPGGTRISHLSHIDGPKSAPIIITKGKSGSWKVDPLPDAPTPPTADDISSTEDTGQLRQWWEQFPNLRPVIEARVNEIKADGQPTEGGDH